MLTVTPLDLPGDPTGEKPLESLRPRYSASVTNISSSSFLLQTLFVDGGCGGGRGAANEPVPFPVTHFSVFTVAQYYTYQIQNKRVNSQQIPPLSLRVLLSCVHCNLKAFCFVCLFVCLLACLFVYMLVSCLSSLLNNSSTPPLPRFSSLISRLNWLKLSREKIELERTV